MNNVTPIFRSEVIKIIAETGKWVGKVGRYTTHLTKIKPKKKLPHLIAWRVCIKRQWHSGEASTVWNALEAVEEVSGAR